MLNLLEIVAILPLSRHITTLENLPNLPNSRNPQRPLHCIGCTHSQLAPLTRDSPPRFASRTEDDGERSLARSLARSGQSISRLQRMNKEEEEQENTEFPLIGPWGAIQ